MELGNSKNIIKGKKDELYHVIHKVPSGDSPYVRAKHAQVILFIYLINLFVFVFFFQL